MWVGVHHGMLACVAARLARCWCADAATALRLMTMIKGIAVRGTTVLCSLHQPRPMVVELLDKVILLSRGQVRDAARLFPPAAVARGSCDARGGCGLRVYSMALLV